MDNGIPDTRTTNESLRDIMERSQQKLEKDLEDAISQRDSLDDKIDDFRKSLSGIKAALKKWR